MARHPQVHIRILLENLGIEVKSKTYKNKESFYIDDLPTALNPEAIRAARVLVHDVSNHQYNGETERGLEYHPSVLTLPGGVPVSSVDATGDWIHLASLVEFIKGIKQIWINRMPFYLRGLVRTVPMTQLHQVLLYVALTDSKANIQVGIDASAYIWVRACQFHGELHDNLDEEDQVIAFHHDGLFYKKSPYITALFSYTEVTEAFATQDITAYQYESAENFIMPLDRYPVARPSIEVYPHTDQVLALRIKVQTAQQFGMILLPAKDRLIITSGVPIKSVVGALDHRGRIIDIKTLATLEWNVLTSPREQSPCIRGMCFLPSLETFHAHRTADEHSDGNPILMNLPAYDPSKRKDVRAQRAFDAPGTHHRYAVL